MLNRKKRASILIMAKTEIGGAAALIELRGVADKRWLDFEAGEVITDPAQFAVGGEDVRRSAHRHRLCCVPNTCFHVSEYMHVCANRTYNLVNC